MTKEQQQVRDFMVKAEQDRQGKPLFEPLQATKDFRFNLIKEELDELWEAMNDCDRIGVADAIGDLMYVVLGTAVTFGIDMEPIFQEIHRSNMTKFIDGHRREDGKWIKGPSYSAPCLQPILDKQTL